MSACRRIEQSVEPPTPPLIALYRECLAETGEPTAAAILAVGMAGGGQTRSERTVLTPPRVAKQLGVDPATVIAWIRSGQLKASNIGQGDQRPRYRIQPSELESFLRKRQPETQTRKQRAKREPDVIQFF